MVELHKKDLCIIFQIVANMLRMFGFILIIPAVAAFIFDEMYFMKLFLGSGFAVVAAFSLIKMFFKERECRIKHALISLALSWIAISVISAIPFVFAKFGIVDALFESFSGWSGTGLTMMQDPALVPHSIVFFRGFIQWVGGFGVVILALLFYEKPKTAQALFLAEGRFEDFFIDLTKIARMIVVIYSIYTGLGVLAFVISGVPFFDAIVHAMTSIATGGYSSNAVGVGIYGTIPMLIAICLMYIGGTSFLTHYKVIKGRFSKFYRNPEVQFMFFISAFAMGILSIDLYIAGKPVYYDGLFYIVSALTGTGNGTPIMLDSFPSLSIVIFVLLMLCGATYGSTSGALKIWRVIIILKNIKREIVKPFYPAGTVLQIKMGNNIITDEDSLKASVYTFLYLAMVAGGSLIFVFAGYDIVNSFFLVSSAQGNVGLTLSTANYFNMNPFLKLQLVVHMLLGRLEIIPLFMLLRGILMVRK